jgi:hypothetical protein
VAAGWGQAEVEARLGSRHPRVVEDDDAVAAVIAGYEVHRYLAVQVSYRDLGSFSGFGAPCAQDVEACIERLAELGLCVEGSECAEVLLGLETKLTSVGLALIPQWRVSDRLSMRGKVGVVAWDSEIHGPAGFGRIESLSGDGLVLGVGVLYELASGLGVLLEYDEVDLDLSSAVVGVSWRF